MARTIKEITAEIMQYAIATDIFVCKNIARLCDELNVAEKARGQIVEEVVEAVCDKMCRYPYEWDEEKEGCSLEESETCRNCVLCKLQPAAELKEQK